MTVIPDPEGKKDGNVNEQGNLIDTRDETQLGPDVPLEPQPITPHPENVEMPIYDRTPAQLAPESTTNLVNLAALISDEFGFSRSEARQMIATGTVTVGGEDLGSPLDLPYEQLKGKEIVVRGDVRSVSLIYRG